MKGFLEIPVVPCVRAKGFQTDVSVLLSHFVDTNSVRYEQFAEVWRNLKMSLIFAGRQSDQEVRQFTEECFLITQSYLQPPCEFQVQVGSLYLLYALYMKQLFDPKVQIRMTLTQWQNLQTLMTEVRNQNHFDIEYVYMRLVHSAAFHFVQSASTTSSFLEREVTEEDADRAIRGTEHTQDNFSQNHSRLSEMVEGNTIDQLSGIHDQYHRVKCALRGPDAKKPTAAMNMIEPDIVQYITKKIAAFEWWKKYKAGKRSSRRRHDSGPTTSESEAESESERPPSSPRKSRNMGSVRAEIKARAMGATATAARGRRHRAVRIESDVEPSPGRRGRADTSQELESSYMDQSTETKLAEGLFNMPKLKGLEEPKGKKRKQRKGRGRPKNEMEEKTKKPKSKGKATATKESSSAEADESLLNSPEAEQPKSSRKRKVKPKAVESTLDSSLETEAQPKRQKTTGSIIIVKPDPEYSIEQDPDISGPISAESVDPDTSGVSDPGKKTKPKRGRGRPRKRIYKHKTDQSL